MKLVCNCCPGLLEAVQVCKLRVLSFVLLQIGHIFLVVRDSFHEEHLDNTCTTGNSTDRKHWITLVLLATPLKDAAKLITYSLIFDQVQGELDKRYESTSHFQLVELHVTSQADL